MTYGVSWQTDTGGFVAKLNAKSAKKATSVLYSLCFLVLVRPASLGVVSPGRVGVSNSVWAMRHLHSALPVFCFFFVFVFLQETCNYAKETRILLATSWKLLLMMQYLVSGKTV